MSEEQTTATAEATAGQESETTDSQETTSKAGSEKQEEVKQEQAQEQPEFVVPEGYEIKDEDRAEMNDFFGKLSALTDPRAREQAMVDEHFRLIGKIHKQGTDAQEAQKQEWATQSLNDTEFGGANLSENIAGARKAMNSFSQPAVGDDGKAVLHQDGPLKGQQMTEMEVLMNESSWGNNPANIRAWHRVAQAISQDTFVQGNMKPVEHKKTAAETMYPNMK